MPEKYCDVCQKLTHHTTFFNLSYCENRHPDDWEKCPVCRKKLPEEFCGGVEKRKSQKYDKYICEECAPPGIIRPPYNIHLP